MAPASDSDRLSERCRCEAQIASTPKPAAPSTSAISKMMRDQGPVTISSACVTKLRRGADWAGASAFAAGARCRRRSSHSSEPTTPNNTVMNTKAQRQPSASVSSPPTSWPPTMPRVLPSPVRVSISCSCSDGTESPTQAIDSGIKAAAPSAISNRANTSMSSVPANTASALPMLHPSVAKAITRNLPTRSPSGP